MLSSVSIYVEYQARNGILQSRNEQWRKLADVLQTLKSLLQVGEAILDGRIDSSALADLHRTLFDKDTQIGCFGCGKRALAFHTQELSLITHGEYRDECQIGDGQVLGLRLVQRSPTVLVI